jgi:23S rRNA pseudouridine1911/1915/1917 synthase
MPSRFVVRSEEAGERLDRLVAQRVPGIGRRLARELFTAGQVTAGGRRVRGATPARAGEEVIVDFTEDAALPDPSLTLDVRLELESLAVVYKPAGQPSAPLRAGVLGTLANAVVHRFPETAGIGHRTREPGLIHRLDTQTSGLMVVARSADAFDALALALKSERLEKRYLALTAKRDLPERGVIDLPLAPDPERQGRVTAEAAPTGYARDAVTRYRVLERGAQACLLELHAARAFRHQIRAHLASIGAPLIGDVLYGGAPFPDGSARHALHASYVAWAGDTTLPSFEVSAGLPVDLSALLGR